ncbi:MAG: hypothetical protein D6732_16965 [Methanobacteriota archaeon]|nr:MAG: hypothetical protein D6732_16965 [Euryarchaeota archaeon]
MKMLKFLNALVSRKNKGNSVSINVVASVEPKKSNRYKKDSIYSFMLFGSRCDIKYFSDFRLIEKIKDPEKYREDPRRWVDIQYCGEVYGYAWDGGYWTHNSAGLEVKDDIERNICDRLNLYCPKVEKNEIITTNRQSYDGKYKIHGRASSMLVEAVFSHNGYVIYFEIDGFKGKMNTRTGEIEIPIRFEPAESAIFSWLADEYGLLKGLGGALPK